MIYDTIMVSYDGSASAQAALFEATKFARADPETTLRIIQIVDTKKLALDKLEEQGRSKDIPTAPDELHKLYDDMVNTADATLHAQIDGVLQGLTNKIIIELLEETFPGEQIITYANLHACDLIIMGSRGLGALRGILGSVSSHVLHNATMPVLIVKQDD